MAKLKLIFLADFNLEIKYLKYNKITNYIIKLI